MKLEWVKAHLVLIHILSVELVEPWCYIHQ